MLNVSVNFLPADFQHRHLQLTKPVRFQYDHLTFPGHQLSAQPVTVFVTNVSRAIESAAAALSFGRAVREAVANVAKHSRANRATISIRFHPGAVAVRVRDDGVGFPESPSGVQPAGRHGLAGMERRVRSCGGRLRIGGRSSVASSGGCVCLVVPLPLSLRVETEVRLGHGHDAGNRETRG